MLNLEQILTKKVRLYFILTMIRNGLYEIEFMEMPRASLIIFNRMVYAAVRVYLVDICNPKVADKGVVKVIG